MRRDDGSNGCGHYALQMVWFFWNDQPAGLQMCRCVDSKRKSMRVGMSGDGKRVLGNMLYSTAGA